MMKPYQHTVLTVLLTVLIPFLLNTATSYFTQDDGYVQFGDPQEIKGSLYLPVVIGNYTAKLMGNLQFSFPSNTDLTGIIMSTPVQLERVANMPDANGEIRVVASGLLPHKEVTLLIPLKERQEAASIKLVNSEEARIAVSRPDLSAPPFVRAMAAALKYALVTALVYGAMVIYTEVRHAQILKQANTEMKKLEARLDEIRGQSGEIHTRCHKHRLLMLSRIRDYSKELDFWRDTIRKVIYTVSDDKKRVETLFEKITESLHTYGTRKEAESEFETILVLAGLVNEAGKSPCTLARKKSDPCA